MDIIKRSSLPPADYRYTVQTQAPAGNWVDVLHCNDQALAVAQRNFYISTGRMDQAQVRVVDEHQ